jgi:allantoicase
VTHGPGVAGGPDFTTPDFTAPDFTARPDLAARRLGGSVMFANDELFAEKENLIKPEPPVFAAGDFGHKGKVYDGWETRRRREPGHDHAIVALGVPGIVHGVVVDTAFFVGNYPPQVSVEAVCADGYPSPAELAAMSWRPLVERTSARGGTANYYAVADRHRWTHVRLAIYPDGGVARFRVHGEPVPDPDFLTGTIDLAALENGGALADCSDAFYSSAANLIMPGRAASMADGWENARRRDGGFDYATFALAASGRVTQVQIDTSYFVGNAPGWAVLQAATLPPSALVAESPVTEAPAADVPAAAEPAAAVPAADVPAADVPVAKAAVADAQWRELLPRVRLQPDTRHRFLVQPAEPATHVRLEVYPDGGLARLRVLGEIVPDALGRLRERYAASHQVPGTLTAEGDDRWH